MPSCLTKTTPSFSEAVDTLVVARDGSCERCDVEVLRQSTLEVRIDGVRAMDVSCTCNDIAELVVGRLYSEGYVSGLSDVEAIGLDELNCTVDVSLAHHCAVLAESEVEDVPTTGTAGKALRPANPAFDLEIYQSSEKSSEELFALRDVFSQDTPLHSRTSGTHSCRLSIDGKVVYTAEDIGRHNALDKAIGWALVNGIDIAQTVLFISGRVPVDMAVKAIRAKVPILASKAAPTSEAVRLARRYGLGLMCFPDGETLRVFSGSIAS